MRTRCLRLHFPSVAIALQLIGHRHAAVGGLTLRREQHLRLTAIAVETCIAHGDFKFRQTEVPARGDVRSNSGPYRFVRVNVCALTRNGEHQHEG